MAIAPAANGSAKAAAFKGGVILLGAGAMATGGLTGSGVAVHHDPHPVPPPHPDPHHPPPPPPPPPHPDPHHPPPPPPPHPDPHPHHPPPPPPDHHPPPPPTTTAATQVPRDEIVLRDNDDDQDQHDGQLIDVSQVSGAATDDLVDAGVTSGSDASLWDPIHVDPRH